MADFETFGGISDAERNRLIEESAKRNRAVYKSNAPSNIGTFNPFSDAEYMARQQALANRLATTTGAERQFVLGNLHPAMLDEKGNIEKFQAFNPGIGAGGARPGIPGVSPEPVLGNLNYDRTDIGAPDSTGRQTVYTTYDRGVRQYIPGLGIVQNMGPQTRIGTGSVGGGNSRGGIFGSLGRNEDTLRRIGGAVTNAGLALTTGGMAGLGLGALGMAGALGAAKGAYTGRAPTGMEVIAALLASQVPKGPLPPGAGMKEILAQQARKQIPGIISGQLERAKNKQGAFSAPKISDLLTQMSGMKKYGIGGSGTQKYSDIALNVLRNRMSRKV